MFESPKNESGVIFSRYGTNFGFVFNRKIRLVSFGGECVHQFLPFFREVIPGMENVVLNSGRQ